MTSDEYPPHQVEEFIPQVEMLHKKILAVVDEMVDNQRPQPKLGRRRYAKLKFALRQAARELERGLEATAMNEEA